MSIDDISFSFITWQQQVTQAQKLALKMPELGLKIDAFYYLSEDDLIGIIAFLKRRYAEKMLDQ